MALLEERIRKLKNEPTDNNQIKADNHQIKTKRKIECKKCIWNIVKRSVSTCSLSNSGG